MLSSVAPDRAQPAARPYALVVDDDPEIRELFGIILRRAGFDVDVADRGAVALQKIKILRPDLVTVDVAMPDMDGFAMIDRLRELPDSPPVVVVSGFVNRIESRPSMSQPVVAYLSKPLRPEELVAACERAIHPSPDTV
jgi:two-component system, OmpR family, response regulator